MTDIIYVEDTTQFDDINSPGLEIHASCYSKDFDDIGWEPKESSSSLSDSEDEFGFYD